MSAMASQITSLLNRLFRCRSEKSSASLALLVLHRTLVYNIPRHMNIKNTIWRRVFEKLFREISVILFSLAILKQRASQYMVNGKWAEWGFNFPADRIRYIVFLWFMISPRFNYRSKEMRILKCMDLKLHNNIKSTRRPWIVGVLYKFICTCMYLTTSMLLLL